MVAALWGVAVWHEFAGAPREARFFLTLMFACYVAAVAVIAAAYRSSWQTLRRGSSGRVLVSTGTRRGCAFWGSGGACRNCSRGTLLWDRTLSPPRWGARRDVRSIPAPPPEGGASDTI